MGPLLIPAIQSGIGLVQSIFGGSARRKAERDLEGFANSYQTSPGILDYYQKALARYNPNAYESSYYQNQRKGIDRNFSAGISSAQNRRSGLAAISTLNQQANDASARAGATAEQLQGQALGQLGQAASLKNQADQKKFDMLYNLKAMKAGQKAVQENQGYQNIFGGISNMAKMAMLGDGQDNSGMNAYKMERMPYDPQTLPYN